MGIERGIELGIKLYTEEKNTYNLLIGIEDLRDFVPHYN